MNTKPPTHPLEVVNQRAMERRQNNRETKVLNLRGMPEELMRRAKYVSAYRGITLKQFAMDCLERCSRVEWDKIQQEMVRDEEDRQKAQRSQRICLNGRKRNDHLIEVGSRPESAPR